MSKKTATAFVLCALGVPASAFAGNPNESDNESSIGAKEEPTVASTSEPACRIMSSPHTDSRHPCSTSP